MMTRCQICGKVHVDPIMGFVNPNGWTPKQLQRIYVAPLIFGLCLLSYILYEMARVVL